MTIKKRLKPLTFFISLLIFLTIAAFYFKKTYNPTAYNWQKDIVTYLAKLTDVFYLPYQFKSHSLSVYYLYIGPQDYLTLNQNLPNPKETEGVLEDQYKIYVPAQLKFENQTFYVQVRYRGYDFDHWTRDKKSFKIKFDQLNPLFDQSELNLIIPEDRGLYLESLSNFRAKKMGLIVPETKFVNLVINDNNHGVYWQVDPLNEVFLAKNNLPLGKLYQEIDQPNRHAKQSIFISPDFWEQTLDESLPSDNTQLVELLDLLNHPNDQKFFRELPQILDIDNFLTWQAHSVLMGSAHQDTYHNNKLFYHPDLNKFIIFPWDVLGGLQWPKDYNPLVTRVLTNPDWLLKRNQILADYLSNPDNLSEDLETYDQLYNQTKTAFMQDTIKYFSNFGYLRQVKKTRQQLIDQHSLIKQSL